MKKKKRDDEELCRQALDQLMNRHGVNPRWEIECSDPPDWWLDFGGRRFAVEATSIHGETQMGDDEKGRANWTKLSVELLEIGEEIRREVEARCSVQGAFVVGLPPIRKIKKEKANIIEALIRYFQVKGTGANLLSPEVVLSYESRGVTISKWRTEGSDLVIRALPFGAAITSRSDQLANILVTTVRNKEAKLRRFTEPKVLIILDQYGFQRSLAEWRSCLPPEASSFYAIVRVQGEQAELVFGTLPGISDYNH